jgi:lipopolysaccharide/colanic/teichoic acid biosynthesis glycosyltransferase
MLIALLVRALSGPGVLYRGRRIGRNGREFEILKFRTMTAGPGTSGVTAADDARITPLGRWLRRTKLDELPQLVNVLRGEMSIVGPRPEDPRFAGHYTGRYAAVLDVRPGITGPAAVQFRHEEELLKEVGVADLDAYYAAAVLPRKLDLDLAYVAHPDLRTDLALLLATARVLPSARAGATPRRDGRP